MVIGIENNTEQRQSIIVSRGGVENAEWLVISVVSIFPQFRTPLVIFRDSDRLPPVFHSSKTLE